MQKDKKDKVEKKYFLVELEVMAPVVLKYRVFSEDEQKACEEINTGTLIEVGKPNLSKMRKIGLKVFNLGTRMLKLTKSF